MKRLGLNLLGILAALMLWELAGRSVGADLFAPPSLVLGEFAHLAASGEIWVELVASLRQMLAGFGLACILGLPLGVAMGRLKLCDALFHPWVSMAIVTSIAALVPLFVLIFGTGFWFRVAIVFVSSIWYVTLTVYQGARGIEPRFIDVGRSFGAGTWSMFWSILMPALYPYLITAMRIGLVHAIRGMVMAEMFIILGFGGMIYRAGYSVSTAPLLALLVALMLVSIAANEILRQLGRAFAPWYEARIAPQGAQRP
jgi:ABC-type nitrate/sulfonate/bicarbonate transport system permease component